MKSCKGQALLEFVLILPVFLMLLFGMIDFGRIIYEKNRLESISNDVVDLVENGLTDAQISDKVISIYHLPIKIAIDRKSVNIIIKLSRSIDVITPGLGIAIDDPYNIEVTRVIYNE